MYSTADSFSSDPGVYQLYFNTISVKNRSEKLTSSTNLVDTSFECLHLGDRRDGILLADRYLNELNRPHMIYWS